MTPDERKAFEDWWHGPNGAYGLRCELPNSETAAAWMAWQVQAEEITRLRTALAASEANLEKTEAILEKAMLALLSIAGHPELYRTTAYDIARAAIEDITASNDTP